MFKHVVFFKAVIASCDANVLNTKQKTLSCTVPRKLDTFIIGGIKLPGSEKDISANLTTQETKRWKSIDEDSNEY